MACGEQVVRGSIVRLALQFGTFLLWPYATRSGGLAPPVGTGAKTPRRCSSVSQGFGTGDGGSGLCMNLLLLEMVEVSSLAVCEAVRVGPAVSFPLRRSLVLPSHKSKAGEFGAESGKWQGLLPGFVATLDCWLPLA